MIEKRFL